MGNPLRDRDYEYLSTMQKAIRRGDERLACRTIYAMIMTGSTPPSIVFNRLRVTVLEDIGPADPATMHCLLKLVDMAQEQRMKNKNGLPWCMAVSNFVVMACRAPKWRIGNSLHAASVADNERFGDPEVPDWALDQHTRRGKAMGRGLEHFFEEGAYCETEAPESDPHLKDALHHWTDETGTLHNFLAEKNLFGQGGEL